MGPGGGPTKMYENPRVSRPLPLIWGWVFDAAASTLVSTLGALSTLLKASLLRQAKGRTYSTNFSLTTLALALRYQIGFCQKCRGLCKVFICHGPTEFRKHPGNIL